MTTLPAEISRYLENAEQVESMLHHKGEGLREEALEDFEQCALSLLKDWTSKARIITIDAIELELDGLLDTIRGSKSFSCPVGTVGHGSDLDLSDCFNDLESTYFDPPSWRR